MVSRCFFCCCSPSSGASAKVRRQFIWRGCSLFTHLFYYTRLGNKVALYFTLFTLFHTFYFISHFSTFPHSCFRCSLWRCRGRMVFDRGDSNRSGKPFIPHLVKRQFSHCSGSMAFYSFCSLPPSSAVASRLSPLLFFFSPLVSPSVTEILWWLYFVILVSFSILDPPSTHGGQSCFETWWFFLPSIWTLDVDVFSSPQTVFSPG